MKMRPKILFICLALALTAGSNSLPTQTSSNPEFPITGPETWTVNGTNFDIEGTAILNMGNGQTLFLVKALCNYAPNATHKPTARALAKYAVDHGYHTKVTSSSWNGRIMPFSGAIGVALIQKQGIGIFAAASGWRYSFKIEDLKE